jgi:hypothetical protein
VVGGLLTFQCPQILLRLALASLIAELNEYVGDQIIRDWLVAIFIGAKVLEGHGKQRSVLFASFVVLEVLQSGLVELEQMEFCKHIA